MSKALEGQAWAPPPSLLTSFPEASGAFPSLPSGSWGLPLPPPRAVEGVSAKH